MTKRPCTDMEGQDMTNEQKTEIQKMRAEKRTYKEIARNLGISLNTVKSYCLRHGINDMRCSPVDEAPSQERCCDYCGRMITSKNKKKRFCSDKCRNKWRAEHPEHINHKAVYKCTCHFCGRSFEAYGNSRRKYCCHECYIKDRFGGSHD